MKKLLFMLCVFVGSCGSEGDVDVSDYPMINSDQLKELSIRKQSIQDWAPLCSYNELTYPCFDYNEDGDMLLFLGLLAASGDTRQCKNVYASQSADGRLWRSPSRVNNQVVNSFSRDMLLGYLLCQTVSPNKESASRFLTHLQTHDYKLCSDAVDDRCELNPVIYRTIWGEMKRVWKRIGLTPSIEMHQGDVGDDHILRLYTEFAPLIVGFNLHLVATELFIRQLLDSETDMLNHAAERVRNAQTENPYFEYIARGRSDRAAALTLSHCPAASPARRTQWMWTREQLTDDWNNPSGWDCLFMINLLTD